MNTNLRNLISQMLACAILLAFPLLACGQPDTVEQAEAEAKEFKAKVDASLIHIKKVADQGPFHPDWKSLEAYEIPEWYLDAKFGIFIHWGVYSVPAFGSEWYPRRMYQKEDKVFAHHLENYGPQKDFGYKDFIPRFKAEKFDAQAWAKLFEQSGARYVVPVAEHHDGFPMYDCGFTNWSAVKMGPKRDVIEELRQAIRGRGLKFGVSSHRAFNWAYFARNEAFDTVDPRYAGLYGKSRDFLFKDPLEKEWPAQDDEFMNDWLARSCELVDKYDPDLIWFDFGFAPIWVESPEANPVGKYLQDFAAYYYNHAAAKDQTAIINYKFQAYPAKAAVLDLERSKMDAIRTPFWQTDTAVSSSSWGYTENQKYKPVNRLVDDLVDIASKNGCLLLNVGPRADGTIPDEDQQILREIGKWLKLNGEAIYESRHWKIYGEGPTGTVTGHLSENKNKAFVAEDIRFTQKGETLYAITLAWPESGKLTVESLKSGADAIYEGEIGSVQLLGAADPIKWTRNEKGLHVELPAKAPCDHAFVLKIER
jgi:alpha-L-fucosidase